MQFYAKTAQGDIYSASLRWNTSIQISVPSIPKSELRIEIVVGKNRNFAKRGYYKICHFQCKSKK